ncbi:MAG: deoxynucleoside kinase [Anaerolineales bacterium]|nr:deoxynucleoside kinase [Anaerolineales bacterium]MCB8953783.1 deoxynucleoside kinase [Ardenticatenales bacterium]
MGKFIAIEGVIGVGKTTLARLLQPHFQAQVVLEVFEENPFLPFFYSDRERYAFQTQLFFLLSRYHQQRKSLPAALRQGNVVTDYTFAKDEIFAWLNLKDDELAMYGRVHAALAEKLPRPDLIVFLRADHDILMRRIALRDRPYERDMDPTYIRSVAAAYDAWLTHLDGIPTLEIDTNELDFLMRESDLEMIAARVRASLADSGSPAASAEQGPRPIAPGETLARFQQFHRDLDAAKGFNPDIFFNFMLLTEEVGEVAHLLTHLHSDARRREREGSAPAAAYQEAMLGQREQLKEELADLLAYVMKLANYAGIDLDEAYRDKMNRNIRRAWTRTDK